MGVRHVTLEPDANGVFVEAPIFMHLLETGVARRSVFAAG